MQPGRDSSVSTAPRAPRRIREIAVLCVTGPVGLLLCAGMSPFGPRGGPATAPAETAPVDHTQLTLTDAQAALETLTSETHFWVLEAGKRGLRMPGHALEPDRLQLGGFVIDLRQSCWELSVQNEFSVMTAKGRFVRATGGWIATLDEWKRWH